MSTFKPGQTVYWHNADILRAKVIEVIESRFRKTRLRVAWFDEGGHETVYPASKFVPLSSWWDEKGNFTP